MPKFRLHFTSDALIHGTAIVEADSLAEAVQTGENAAHKSGVDDAMGVDWDETGATFLDNADFDHAEEVVAGEVASDGYYSDRLDAERQVDAEEMIAATLHETRGEEMDEEACAELGRTLLKAVLLRFRPDLFVQRAG